MFEERRVTWMSGERKGEIERKKMKKKIPEITIMSSIKSMCINKLHVSHFY